MKIYDVTVSISNDLPAFPGDPKIEIVRTEKLSDGGSANVSTLSFGSHTGTHVDPPYHFIDDGLKADQLPLEILIGRTHVFQVTAPEINEAVLGEFDFTDVARVLFKTRNSYFWKDGGGFVPNFVYITPKAAEVLVHHGVKLVGIDYLSVEKFHSRKFKTHQILLGNGVIIVEGLDLSEVEPDDYEMICLPLKIKDGDGAPARVILRK